MENKIAKLLENKYENVVQFNVVNTTQNPIYLNLFNTSDLSVIPNSPTYLYSPNTPTGNIGTVAPFQWIILANNGFIYTDDGLTNILIVNPATNSVIGSISLGIYNASWLTYNPINNTIYSIDNINNIILVIDCATNTILTTISVASPVASVFNSVQNTLYVTSFSGLVVIDCNTNSIITTIVLTCNFIEYNSTNNLIYTTESSSSNVTIIDCLTNTISGFIPLTSIIYTMFYVSNTNFLYVSNNTGDNLAVIDCSTNIILSNNPIPSGIGNLTFATIDTNSDNVYWGTNLGYSIIISTSTNTITNYFFIASSQIGTSVFLPSTNEIYFACPLLSTLTIVTTAGVTTTSYYISGSANYNAFVNNLNNEPVEIQMIRLFVENQEQLYNQLQLTKIDSSGNQIFLPDFPINQVDIMQQQGNIGEIPLENIVFDGRTYINQYKLNAYESISFEIYYTQLDLTSATPTFPIFFKPKIQLKEYIKKELNL